MSETQVPPPAELRSIVLRAYAEGNPQPEAAKRHPTVPRIERPSVWSVVWDTETTVDASQALRFGTYQVRESDRLYEAGIFHSDDISADDFRKLQSYAEEYGHELRTRESFVEEILYRFGYKLRGTIIGFNLPFDFSRIALRAGRARGNMYGGFSFTLSRHAWRPPLQVKHLSRRMALIRFAAPAGKWDGRSFVRNNRRTPVRRGFFVDLNTTASALLSRSFTLKSLGTFLGVEHEKLSAEAHGAPLTDEYIEYAVRDPQTTWECYAELSRRYDALGLTKTQLHRIYSEASVGKAYLKEMGIKPWREVQPDVPAALKAQVMSTYFGGPSEVRIRRELRQVVLCDFLSMYLTVCTLMNLWRFVAAGTMSWRDATDDIREFLNGVTLDKLKEQTTWLRLTGLVQIEPDGDAVPVRATYDDKDPQATIGLNHLSSDAPVWITIADCVQSKLLSGRVPKIRSALLFEPGPTQNDLRPVLINGNEAYRVDPRSENFFKRVIELRRDVQGQMKNAPAAEREKLDAEQLSLKIVGNSTNYGIFAELNVQEQARKASMTVHSAIDDAFSVQTLNREEPGRYFHPLLASLIAGAARLMLATAETLVLREALDWSFCDTDSIAIAKPAGMSGPDFHDRVNRIVKWFDAHNPYTFNGSILKVEDVNFSLAGC